MTLTDWLSIWDMGDLVRLVDQATLMSTRICYVAFKVGWKGVTFRARSDDRTHDLSE